jgi:hypothetical protein
MTRLLTAILFLFLNANIVSAQAWNCRNEATEISCGGNKCEVSENHTPMDVSFDISGKIKICAYSGCSQGISTSTLFSGAYLTLISDSLKWNAKATEKSTTAALTIDRRNLTAKIMIENFVHPMICQIRQ